MTPLVIEGTMKSTHQISGSDIWIFGVLLNPIYDRNYRISLTVLGGAMWSGVDGSQPRTVNRVSIIEREPLDSRLVAKR
jgi:hypothetical protein